MLRVVLAALLAVALVATASTALEDARVSRSETLADGQAGELDAAVADLHRSETALADHDAAARRVVQVDVPTGGVGTAPVAFLSLGGVPGGSVDGDTASRDVVAYAVEGGPVRVHWLPVDVRVVGPDGSLAGDDRPLVLRSAATVVLTFLEHAGRPVVAVRRR